jgi:anti-sigma B factor antagonist
VPNHTVTKSGSRAVIALEGRLDLLATADLRRELHQLMHEGAHDLVFDLKALESIDSAGIGLLVGTHNALAKLNGSLAVRGASEELVTLLRLMRLSERFLIAAG